MTRLVIESFHCKSLHITAAPNSPLFGVPPSFFRMPFMCVVNIIGDELDLHDHGIQQSFPA